MLLSHSIKQIYCKRIRSSSNRNFYYIYNIETVLNTGRTVIVDNFGTSKEVKTVEKLLEKHLGIRDQRVSSEV